MGDVSTIGLDIAKSVFQAHGADASGAVVFPKKLGRARLLAFFAAQPRCMVAMEACAGAHHWGRELMRLGHTVRLIPPAYVKPFVKRQKNDVADAEATEKSTAALASQIAEFSKDKSHFKDVEDDVANLIPAIRAKNPNDKPLDILAKAYDAAIWANPAVRERILADQRKADEEKRRAESVKKATDAKKSAAVNVKSGTAGKTTPRSWTDTLESEADRLFAG